MRYDDNNIVYENILSTKPTSNIEVLNTLILLPWTQIKTTLEKKSWYMV